MKKLLIEICCGSAEDVIEAALGGADRVELNSSLFQGGLTPTIGALIMAKEHAHIPVMSMIRPREGGFCYTDKEFKTAMKDAELLLQYGTDGLVFGFLNPDGTIDKARCKTMMELGKNIPMIFHRAIDVTPDWRAALDILMELGLTRVLTSGQAPSAVLGAATIRDMVAYIKNAGSKLEILPGAGIKPANALQMAEATGCNQLHMSMHKLLRDDSTAANPAIHFGGALYPPEDVFKLIDRDTLTSFTQGLQK